MNSIHAFANQMSAAGIGNIGDIGNIGIIQICTVLTGFLFLFLAWRTRSFTKALFSLKDQTSENFAQNLDESLDESGAWPKLSIVIPARDEAHTIEAAAQSLLKIDYPNIEIVFVNDRSADHTGKIMDQIAAENAKFKAVHIEELPENWLGKVHAMHRGVAQTSGDWILMTDADVHFSVKSLKKAISYCRKNNLDFLTVIPDLLTPTFGLQMMMAHLYHQASLFFNPKKLNEASHKVCYGQGAFLLFNRNIYEKSEGLEWLKMEVVDDTGFALMMRRAGAKMGAVSGRNEIQLEWYPSLRSMIKGLEKNAFAICQYSVPVVIGFTAMTWLIFLGFTLFPILTKSWSYATFSLSCLLIYMLAIDNQLKRLMHIRPMSMLTFPFYYVFFPFIVLRSAVLAMKRSGIQWRGNFYSLEQLKANQRMKMVNLVFKAKDLQELQES